jgi:glucose-6-phosphate dehydrogenase assembly protein OpcA
LEEAVIAVAPPEKILKDLAELWVTTGKQEAGVEAQGVLRACTMTLIVITEDREDPSGLGETIAALMPEHPARTIVIRLTGAGERSIAQRVFAQCWMPFGQRRQICCEQVEITCSDASLGDLPSVVLPLEVPDLPVILWCRSPRLLGMADFPALAAMARRVVVDSSALTDAPAALRRLADEAAHGMLLGDLAWTRLTRWRQTLAQIFEDPRHAARLTGAARITVCDGGAVTTQALYMGTWMAGALEAAGVSSTVHVRTKPLPNSNAATSTPAWNARTTTWCPPSTVSRSILFCPSRTTTCCCARSSASCIATRSSRVPWRPPRGFRMLPIE